MSIGFGKQSSASVPTPPVGEQNFFVDTADDKFKKKLPDTSVVDLEGLAAGVVSVNAQTGVVSLDADDIPEGVVSKYFTEAKVLATVILGFQISWGILTAADSVLTALKKLAGISTMTPNSVSADVEVPAQYTWIRQNRTRFVGTTKIGIKAGGKIRFIN